jgi:hypothetical protein
VATGAKVSYTAGILTGIMLGLEDATGDDATGDGSFVGCKVGDAKDGNFEGFEDKYSKNGLFVISRGDGALVGLLVKFKFRYTTPLQVAKNKQFSGLRQKKSVVLLESEIISWRKPFVFWTSWVEIEVLIITNIKTTSTSIIIMITYLER